MSVDLKLAAMLMEQDSYFNMYGFLKDFKSSFPEVPEAEFKKEFARFESEGSIIGLDVEADVLDGASFEHEVHGSLDMKDLFLITGDDRYYAIGSSFLIRLYEMKGSIMETAVDAGLSDAARLLNRLPIDSSGWTGVPVSFAFNATAKGKVLRLIERARGELASANMSNGAHSKADAYLDCALILAEQDDPDPDIIATLIKRGLIIMGAVGLLADFKTIFWTN